MKLFIMMLLLGSAGAICRYLTVLSFSYLLPTFSHGTLCVNLLGAYMAGFVFVIFRTRFAQWGRYEPACLVGFMGGFTTFSSYTLEVIRLFSAEQYLPCVLYIGITNILGLIAAYLGVASARRLYPYRHRYKKKIPVAPIE